MGVKTQWMDGKMLAGLRKEKLAQEVAEYRGQGHRPPGLAVILVGEDPASQVYVKNKISACQQVGVSSTEHRLPAQAQPQDLKELIEGLNRDPRVDGILLQLPLPQDLDEKEALGWIDPSKDVDCLTAQNLGRLLTQQPLTLPCTPKGVMSLLSHYQIPLEGREAVVVGRSQIVGKPMALMLLEAHATVTICHSRSQNLRQHLQRADVVVVAAGRPEFLGREDFKSGAVVVDVGIHRRAQGRGLCGDVRSQELEGWASALTPVPGGVGPMTIVSLLENCFRLYTETIGQN